MPCTFTEDRTRIREADGLILEVSVNGMLVQYCDDHFLGANDWPYRNPPLMPPKFSEQPWIMLSYEQPDYFRIQSDRVFVRNIDLNATYDQSSQVWPYSVLQYVKRKFRFLSPLPAHGLGLT